MFVAQVRRNRQLSRQIISLNTDMSVIVKQPEAQAELVNEFFDTVLHHGQPSPIHPVISHPFIPPPILKLRNPLLQWGPDISTGPVQPDHVTIRGVGHKAVLLPLKCIWPK